MRPIADETVLLSDFAHSLYLLYFRLNYNSNLNLHTRHPYYGILNIRKLLRDSEY